MLANTLVRRVPLSMFLRGSAQALSTWSAVPAGPPDPILGARFNFEHSMTGGLQY